MQLRFDPWPAEYPVVPKPDRRPEGRPPTDPPEGAEGPIVRVYEKDPALLKLFAGLKLQPGARLRLVRKLADDTFEIHIEGRKAHIGLKAARGLWMTATA